MFSSDWRFAIDRRRSLNGACAMPHQAHSSFAKGSFQAFGVSRDKPEQSGAVSDKV